MLNFLKRVFTPAIPSETAAPVATLEPPPAPVAPPPVIKPAAPPAAPASFISLDLSEIAATLPGGVLRPDAKIEGIFRLPMQTALVQLPTGRVRIPFPQLRQAAPSAFVEDATLEEAMVDLPLPKILAALDPAVFSRRVAQTRIDAPPEIPSVFGIKPPTLTPAPARPPVAAPVPPPLPVPPLIAFSPPSATPSSAEPALTVALASLCEFWPEAVRQEMAQSGRQNASVALPISRLDTAMKTGRVTFSWGELAPWIQPAMAAAAVNRNVVLELPLKVIAPLFLAQRRASASQKEISVGENVPNLFAPSGRVAAAPVAPPPVATPVMVPMPAPAPTPTPAVEATPLEIVQNLNLLPGIAGSVIAMTDGLLVAGTLPPPLKSETLAAFLPQIFGRLTNYAAEVQLGSLHGITLWTAAAPCAIFKTDKLFLAVLGKAGEPLPDAALHRIAGELAKRT